MPKTDALIALHTHLVKGGREDYAQVIPAKYAKLSAVDVYDRFVGVRMEAKGMMASGFGATGIELEFDVGMDFGDLVLPGLLSMKVSLGAQAQGKNFALLLIHRGMPHYLPNQLPGAAASPVWATPKPTCFMTLFGRSFSITLTSRASLYVLQDPITLPEDGAAGQALSLTELPLTLSAGVTTEQSYTYQAMKVYDWGPGWYCCEQEQALRTDFNNIIQTIGKKDLKVAIRSWLANFERIYDWPAAVSRVKKQKGAAPIQLQDIWDDYLTYQLRKHDRVSRSQQVKVVAKRTYAAVVGGSPVDPTLLGKMLGGYWDDAMAHLSASADLQTRLAAIINIIPSEDYVATYAQKFKLSPIPSTLDIIRQETGLIRNQAIEFYYRLGEASDTQMNGLPTNVFPPKWGALAGFNAPWWYLAFLKISSHAAEGSAGANVSPMLARLQGTVSGQIKRTAYRYQTYSLSEDYKRTLVYTQDTMLIYRQAVMAAGAATNLVSLQPGKSYSGSAGYSKFVTNGMNYRSVGVYWLYPDRVNQPNVLTQMGSGLSYGVSVNSADLLAMLSGIAQIKSAAQTGQELKISPRYDRMLQTLAGYLRMSKKSLGEFLAAIPMAKQAGWATMESLLIEVSYSFKPLNLTTSWKPKGGVPVCELPGLWLQDPIPYCDNFDAIRIRCRMADHRQSQHSFRLQASYVADFGIVLSGIEEAGSESVLDLHTEFYNGKNHETAVPPVAIFYQ